MCTNYWLTACSQNKQKQNRKCNCHLFMYCKTLIFEGSTFLWVLYMELLADFKFSLKNLRLLVEICGNVACKLYMVICKFYTVILAHISL